MKKIILQLLCCQVAVLLSASRVETHLPQPIPTAYIYGYNSSIIVAQVLNATQAQVAYTGFETNINEDKGNWIYSGTPGGSKTDPGRTGIRYYSLTSGSLQRTGLPIGRYIVSYWATGAVTVNGGTPVKQSSRVAMQGWTYSEKLINITTAGTTLTLSGTGRIDEVRLYPEDAQMISYTYDLLVGKTSETDATNLTVYYEYDEFNRMRYVKDQYGNIIKRYTYHYKN
jgi:hypothetical protein